MTQDITTWAQVSTSWTQDGTPFGTPWTLRWYIFCPKTVNFMSLVLKRYTFYPWERTRLSQRQKQYTYKTQDRTPWTEDSTSWTQDRTPFGTPWTLSWHILCSKNGTHYNMLRYTYNLKMVHLLPVRWYMINPKTKNGTPLSWWRERVHCENPKWETVDTLYP